MNHSDYCRQFVRAGGSVLDVGSGRGRFLLEMAGFGLHVFGVEPSTEYLEAARALARARAVTVSFSHSGGERLPFSDASFDFVNCSEVTEHTNDPRAVCREIFRVLKRRGRAYISFHNRFGVYDYHYHLWVINWMPRVWADALLSVLGKQKKDSPQIGRQKLSSMHYYTFSEVRSLLSSLGLSVRDIRENKIYSRFGRSAPVLLLVYRAFLRPLYFNTFHLLVQKL